MTDTDSANETEVLRYIEALGVAFKRLRKMTSDMVMSDSYGERHPVDDMSATLRQMHTMVLSKYGRALWEDAKVVNEILKGIEKPSAKPKKS